MTAASISCDVITTSRCRRDYLPATLTSKDYPNLIPEGEKVDTIAVPAVLAAYNWTPGSERYRKLVAVRRRVLREIPDLAESAVPSEVEGDVAVGAARRLESPALRAAMARQERHPAGRADQVRRIPEAEPSGRKGAQSEADRDALFKQFQAWQADQAARDKPENARAQVPRSSKQQ